MNIRIKVCCSTILIILILIGCERDFSSLSEFEGRWISDMPFTYSISDYEYTLPHDNRIYESTNFLIFSDASSDEVKMRTSNMAEVSLNELKRAFDIPGSTDLGIIDRDSKVMIYANKYRDYLQQYFAYGFIIYSIDSPNNLFADNYVRLVKHELMHVFQHLLGLGLDGYDDWPEVWFSEGIAEFMAGGVHTTMTNYNQVIEWMAVEDHINPIRIHRTFDYPVPFIRYGEYYPMFELAVRYLLDKKGQKRTISEVKHLFEALRNGDSFADAFESYMGISLLDYEDHFYELISEFLQP